MVDKVKWEGLMLFSEQHPRPNFDCQSNARNTSRVCRRNAASLSGLGPKWLSSVASYFPGDVRPVDRHF